MNFYLEYPDGMRPSRLFKDGTVSIGTGEWLDHKVTAAVMEFTLKEWLDVTNLAQRFPNSICPPIKNFGGRPSIQDFEGRPSIQDPRYLPSRPVPACPRRLVSRSKLRGQGKQFHPPYNSELEAAVVLIGASPRAAKMVFGDSPSVFVFIGQDVESAMRKWMDERDKKLNGYV